MLVFLYAAAQLILKLEEICVCDFVQDGIFGWQGCKTVAWGGGIRGGHYPKTHRALGPDHQTVLPACPLIISLAAADHGLSPADRAAGRSRWPGGQRRMEEVARCGHW